MGQCCYQHLEESTVLSLNVAVAFFLAASFSMCLKDLHKCKTKNTAESEEYPMTSRRTCF